MAITPKEENFPGANQKRFANRGGAARKEPPAPLQIIVTSGAEPEIFFFSKFQYAEKNKAAKPGRWNPVEKNWIYPATPAIAARLLAEFSDVLPKEKDAVIDAKFYELAAAGRDSLRMKINRTKELIHIYAPYSTIFVDSVRSIPGRKFEGTKEPKHWTIPATVETVKEMRRVFTENMPLEFQEAELSAGVQKLLAMAAIEVTRHDHSFASKTPLWLHQTEAARRAYDAPGYYLAHDMGTGKTLTAITVIVNSGLHRVLIICPKKVISTWPKEFETHAARPFKVLDLDDRRGQNSNKEKALALKNFIRVNQSQDLAVVINYESAWRSPMKEVLMISGFDGLIIDEAHKAKAAGGKASLFLFHLARRIESNAENTKLLALSGTPMPNNPLDIYAQYRIIRPDIFGTKFALFKQEYAIMGNFENVVGFRNQADLNRKIYQAMHRVLTKDVQDLPAQTHTEITFPLSSETARIYNELENTSQADIVQAVAQNRALGVSTDDSELLEEMITAKGWNVPEYDPDNKLAVKNAMNLSMKLLQITGGWTKNESGEYVRIGNEKGEALQELLEALAPETPVVVFCTFVKELDTVHIIAETLGRASLEVSGRKNDLASWQAGKAPILAVNISAGGAGVNLTGQDMPDGQRRQCQYAIFYSAGHKAGDIDQAIKRTDRYRPDMPKNDQIPCFYYWLRATIETDKGLVGSIDMHAARAVEKKRITVANVLDKSASDLAAADKALREHLEAQAAAAPNSLAAQNL